MSLNPQTIEVIPEETVRVAKAAFPDRTVYMKMRDEFGTIFTDEQFVDLYPQRGPAALAPWRLALIAVMQLPKTSPMARQPMRCVVGLTGNTPSRWN